MSLGDEHSPRLTSRLTAPRPAPLRIGALAINARRSGQSCWSLRIVRLPLAYRYCNPVAASVLHLLA
jgi:hypothetical protein